ncbi:hypothetical protein BDV96DRAFT_689617 [Lophiotrema nucula]|uniref:Uncharacterized protein n=1 Tax=Lophiotrema nucula TaxID=690887 RepID=A0A6A5YZN0_9PLEO|nr:hypothetical protein BDV96DRAFT_689617 [Lophiotrema nucula]
MTTRGCPLPSTWGNQTSTLQSTATSFISIVPTLPTTFMVPGTLSGRAFNNCTTQLPTASAGAIATYLPSETDTVKIPLVDDRALTIIFGVLGTVIGVFALILAYLTLRFMYKSRKERRIQAQANIEME